jgi:hypothetical protein
LPDDIMESLIERAGVALYEVKKTRRSQVKTSI